MRHRNRYAALSSGTDEGRLMSLAEIDIVTEVLCYEDVHSAMRLAAEDLQISRLAIDELAGTSAGHAAKLLCDPPMKRASIDSINWLLPVLGMKLLLVRDHDAVERLKHRRPKRHGDKISNATPPGANPWERAHDLRVDQCRKAG
jgi:hypothetical protein